MTPDSLVWLIPVPPLLAFFIIVLFTNKNKALSHTLAIGLMALSWVLSWGIFVNALGYEIGARPGHHRRGSAQLDQRVRFWREQFPDSDAADRIARP